MKNNKYSVVIFAYQRPEAVAKILKLSIKAGTKKIYIFADGPKQSQDKILINQVKDTIIKIQKDHLGTTFVNSFSKTNKGLTKNIIQGLNQVFAEESAAIILEDDCIPALDFFKFTNQMLTKYKANPKIMSVSGTSINYPIKTSYDFSRYVQVWGWATWARAWQLYDFSFNKYQKLKWGQPLINWYWQNILLLVKKGIIDTWCYQWTYSHFKNHGLTVIPSVNLVKNIGFDDQATHTKVKVNFAGMKIYSLKFPLTHPNRIIENHKLSQAIENKFYLNPIVILGLIKYKFISLFK